MSALARRMSPEYATRALDLPQCPSCAAYPLRVTDAHSLVYVHCPQCRASTHKVVDAKAAKRQWCALVLCHE